MKSRILISVLVSLALSGCVTVEKASFAPQAGQELLVRSGTQAILSRAGSTQLVIVPASRARELPRPTYVALIRNVGGAPVTFRYEDIKVIQADTGKPLKVWTVDQLQAEARRQAVAAAILGGMVGVAGGYYAGSVSVNGRNYDFSGYNSMAGTALAASNINSAMQSGEINVAALENNMLMDNTILPGEAYGGMFQFDAAKVTDLKAPKNYAIEFRIGRDVHRVKLSVIREEVK